MNTWTEFIKQQEEKPYYEQLMKFVQQEYRTKTIYPKQENLYRAFALTPYEKVKVVILGQDPYHQPNQASGLAFSINPNCKIPPSLRNIYQELKTDLNIVTPSHGCLDEWAKQGVLLINTIYTVEDSHPLSHQGQGWETFTKEVFQALSLKKEAIVYVLWGKKAQAYEKYIHNANCLIIKSNHPSPLSAYRGFFNSKPFSKINAYLAKEKITEIDWSLICK